MLAGYTLQVGEQTEGYDHSRGSVELKSGDWHKKATCWWLFGVVLGCVEAVEAVGAIGWRWWRLERDFDNNGQITIGSAPAGSVVMD